MTSSTLTVCMLQYRFTACGWRCDDEEVSYRSSLLFTAFQSLFQDTMSPLTQHVISQQHKESQAEHKPAVIWFLWIADVWLLLTVSKLLHSSQLHTLSDLIPHLYDEVLNSFVEPASRMLAIPNLFGKKTKHSSSWLVIWLGECLDNQAGCWS